MRVSIDITGLNKAISDLKKIGMAGADVIEEVVTDVTLDAQDLAVSGIMNGPASGATYKRGTVTHRASAPGEYPMSDTGRLASNVEHEFLRGKRGVFNGIVGTNIVYGPYLEFGTSRMAARPWLGRSLQQASENIAQQLVARMKAAT